MSSSVKVSSFYKSFLFLLRFIDIFPTLSIKEERVTLTTASQEFKTVIYSPSNALNYKNNSVIFLQHGMNVKGIEDPRIKKLGKNFASLGYIVVIPEFYEIKRLKITSKTIDNQRECLQYLFNLFRKKIGYIAPSFPAGQGLIAISDKSIQSMISSIFLIGCYADFKKTLKYCVNHYNIDNYGFFIFLYNFIDLVFPDCSNIKNVFKDIIITENNPLILEKKIDKILKYHCLSVENKILLSQILSDNLYRQQLTDSIINKLPSELIEQLSPINFIQDITCPIFLIHGAKDPVISPESTRLLYQKIPTHCKSGFLISDLLSHGDVSLYKILNHVTCLLKIFSQLFASIA